MIDVLLSGGPVMIPLLLLSVIAVAIVVERAWALRRGRYLDERIASTLTELLARRDFAAALDYCRRHPGPFTQLVGTLVENRHAPYDELKEILEDTGRHQLQGLERGLPVLATIVAGAPLLGLLGTVVGMIEIFTVVADVGGTVAERLSAGIAEALITTATGLIIAIPALFLHAWLEGRAVGLIAEIEAALLDYLHLVRRPTPEAVDAAGEG